ncbi:hypothetical protein Y1Q_0009856 [Alligator mississippiensis]|uniref:Integrase catalytic domain-containing protein n=1 Tax=Alligator mississippiensis TaxID=8496 RepID=A0A151MX11_ALLMI|nr:hypothetical protein Y1Q_0009856 [Alligator mississippiensis]
MNFTLRVFEGVSKALGIKHLKTAVYHPQTDALVECFNQTLKQMLKKFVAESPQDWDKMIPPLLSVVREAPQASTGFSPFELLYGRQPRGILNLIKEGWEEQRDKDQNLIQYVIQLRERLEAARSEVIGNLREAQQRQVRYYSRGTRERKFEVGDHVLVLLPDWESKLLAQWQGSYEVIRQVGPLDYEVYQVDKQKKKQVYHINLLKKWEDRECMYLVPHPEELELGPSLTEESEPGNVELAS